ncbi:MAG: hypothetical protein HFF25_08020 [Oscillospiraceae bacterium]|nr:hypothetical protein [Oscillospiraceae bacterium]
MIERRPDYYTQFHCLGGACPDTCCRDWAVVLDEDALADYAAAPAPLGERIARNLATDGDGDVCFRLDEAGLCALLTPGGLCAIQKDWGEAHLCAHCAAYPRFTEEYGCLTETALAVSCPEAARLLLEAPRFSLVETYDGVGDPPFDGVDPGLLSMLEVSRAAYLALLSCGPNPFWEKLRVLLSCTQVLQARIDAGNYSALDVCAPARAPSVPGPCRPAAVRLLELLSGLDPLRPDWPVLLRERARQLSALSPADYAALRTRYEQANPRWERQLTNLACYLVFRHWHKAVNDDALYGRAALVCAACTALYHLSLFQPGEEAALWARFSREVEHDGDNLSGLIRALGRWAPSDFI